MVSTTNAKQPNDEVYFVIPAYNEATRIGRVLDDLRREYQHVIVIDDGSRDNTSHVARQHGCIVLRHSINRGQGAALQTGITFALSEGANYIVTFDADGQHLSSDLPAMLRPVIAGECDLTLGNRFMVSGTNIPPFRRLVLQAASLFTYFSSGLSLGDCHNGYRVFSRQAAQKIYLRQDRMAHASELYDQIRQAALTFQEVPVTIRYTEETLAKGQRLSNSLSLLFQYFYGKIAQ